MKTFCAAVVMAASAFAENIAPQVNQQFVQQHQEQQYNTGADQRQDGNVVSAGEWINVGDNQWANAPQNEWANVPDQWGYAQPSPARNPWEFGFNGGLGIDTQPIIKWGLGAVLIMLIVSTAISVGTKVWPRISDMINVAEEARSLEQVSSLAQYAFQAFEKYQALNDEDNE